MFVRNFPSELSTFTRVHLCNHQETWAYIITKDGFDGTWTSKSINICSWIRFSFQVFERLVSINFLVIFFIFLSPDSFILQGRWARIRKRVHVSRRSSIHWLQYACVPPVKVMKKRPQKLGRPMGRRPPWLLLLNISLLLIKSG